MVFECPFDHLVENIRRYDLVNIASGKPICERLDDGLSLSFHVEECMVNLP